MIDGIRSRRHVTSMHPRDREMMSKAVVGQHQSHHEEPKKEEFKPPEAVAAEETTPPSGPNGFQEESPPNKPPKNEKKRSFGSWFKGRSKKWWVVFSLIALLVLGGLGYGAYLLFGDKAEPAKQETAKQEEPEEAPKPVTVEGNLSGLQVDPAVNERPVTGVMIENSPDARPQSSLEFAHAVFEAVAEGGITRFLALYQDHEPNYIGPVRSVRPYYVQWAMGFDAPVAHVGGSADGLALVRQGKDLDQFSGGDYFFRIPSRAAPHNVYTTMGNLRAYEASKGYGKSVFTSYARKAEAPAPAPSVKGIDFNISGAYYNAHFDYDAPSNSYLRSVGGEPHMEVDQNGTPARLAPKVVVALIMPQGANGKYTTYQTIGTGTAFVFQDGIMIQGVWRKDANNLNFVFTTPEGAPLALNAGQVWFTALGGSERVTYR